MIFLPCQPRSRPPAKTICSPKVSSMLGHRLRRRPDIELILGDCLLFSALPSVISVCDHGPTPRQHRHPLPVCWVLYLIVFLFFILLSFWPIDILKNRYKWYTHYIIIIVYTTLVVLHWNRLIARQKLYSHSSMYTKYKHKSIQIIT